MKKKKMIFAVAAVAASAAMPLVADTWNDGTSVSSSAKSFVINTKDDTTYAYEGDYVSSFAVTWRSNETVTVTDRSGTADTTTGYPSSAAASDGSVAFSASAGGMWTLVNSNSGTAYIVVPWLESELGTNLATSAALDDLAVDTVQTTDNGEGGINRKGKIKELPGYVAFSCDDWVRGSSADSCTLKFTSPSGAVTTESLTGTGTQSFTFTKAGTWTIELVVDDTTVRKATVNAAYDGLMIIIK